MKRGSFLILALVGLLFGQGTPHTMLGTVLNPSGNPPLASCLYFKAFIVSKPDTLYYPADQPTTNYLEDSGTWFAEISSLLPVDGDIFIVMFANACSSYVGSDTATVDLSEPSQNIGTTYLAYGTGCIDRTRSDTFSLLVSPSPFNSDCNIEIIGAGQVSVKVFNVLGQLEEQIYEGRSSGRVIVKWNPNAQPAGVYFIKAKIGSLTLTQRVFYLP